jgi:hypothetical protein
VIEEGDYVWAGGMAELGEDEYAPRTTTVIDSDGNVFGVERTHRSFIDRRHLFYTKKTPDRRPT